MSEPPRIPELMPAPEVQAPTMSGPPKMSLSARLLNVFAVPGEVFEDVKNSFISPANWLVPALLCLAVSWVSGWLILSQAPVQQQMREMSDQIVQKLVEKGHLTQQQADLQRHGGELGAQLGSFVSSMVISFGTPFGWGAILWLIGTRGFGGNFPFMKAVEVVGLASTISALGVLVKTLLVLGFGHNLTGTNPTVLVKGFDPQKASYSVLTVVNLTTFWVLAIRALGLAKLSGAPFLRAAWCVFAVWFSYMALLLGLGLAVRSAFGV
jgi:hypothetical protein